MCLASIVLAACTGTAASSMPRDMGMPDAGPSTVAEKLAALGLSSDEIEALEATAPESLPTAPPDISSKVSDDPDAARFGQKLFMDPAFSGALLNEDNDGTSQTLGHVGETGKVACAGCHIPATDFLDTRSVRQQISLAASWGMRRTPSLLDIAQVPLLMWDGRHDTLYNQIFGAIENVLEMNSSRLFTAQEVFRRYRVEYEGIFGPMPPLDDTTRFPPLDTTTTGCRELVVNDGIDCHGMPGDGAEFDSMSAEDQDAVTRVVVNVGKAIGAYERRLTCGTSRFDAWMHGDEEALSESEQRGAAIFAGRGQCVDCHSGPFLSDQRFHNVGMAVNSPQFVDLEEDDPGAARGLAQAMENPLNVHGEYSDGDDGRLDVTIDERMTGAFRTPMLRCLSSRPSFMHTGQYRALADVVSFFSRGGHAEDYVGTKEIEQLDLTSEEQADLVAFLRSLDGPGAPSELTEPL